MNGPGLAGYPAGGESCCVGHVKRSPRGGEGQGELRAPPPIHQVEMVGGDRKGVQAGPAACGCPGQPLPAQRAWPTQLDGHSITQAPVSPPRTPESVWLTPGDGLGATWQEKFQPQKLNPATVWPHPRFCLPFPTLAPRGGVGAAGAALEACWCVDRGCSDPPAQALAPDRLPSLSTHSPPRPGPLGCTGGPAGSLQQSVCPRWGGEPSAHSALRLSLSPSLSVSISLCFSLSLSVCVSVSLCLCHSLSPSLFVSVSPSLSVSLSVSVYLCLSVSVSVFLIPSVSPSPVLSLSLSSFYTEETLERPYKSAGALSIGTPLHVAL